MAKYLRPTGAYMPTGSVVTWLTATAPEGWLICNGDAISRTTYADLYSVIGTTFGVGDGSTGGMGSGGGGESLDSEMVHNIMSEAVGNRKKYGE